jgi:hypothetical protein
VNFSSMRNAIVIAIVTIGSVIPSQTFAQTDVLTPSPGSNILPGITSGGTAPLVCTYTFNTSMILNSIDFVTRGYGTDIGILQYSISSVNNGDFQTVDFNDANLGLEIDYVRRFSLSNAVTLSANDIVRIKTTDTANDVYGPFSAVKLFGPVDSNVNVSFVGSDQGILSWNYSNSNLRVSNPGSNVAPEPGTFALARTGGGALLGICIRRRRNAA